MSGATPDSLLARLARRDRKAMLACLDRYGALVWSLARRYATSPGDAEAAARDAFEALADAAGSLDPARAAEPILVAKVVRRRLIDRRRARCSEPVPRRPDPPDRRPRQLELPGDAVPVAEALARLPAAQRRALELAVVRGLTHAEIAGLLDQPRESVSAAVWAGLVRVREAMHAARGERHSREAAGGRRRDTGPQEARGEARDPAATRRRASSARAEREDAHP